MNKSTNIYKVSLVGFGGVGKTLFSKYHLTGTMLTQYIPTIGVETHRICKNSSNKRITFNIWDTAGNEKFGGLRYGYYVHSDMAMIMVDSSSPSIAKDVIFWHGMLAPYTNNIPIVVVVNKIHNIDVDIREKILIENYFNEKGVKFAYNVISTTTCENINSPFLSLLSFIEKQIPESKKKPTTCTSIVRSSPNPVNHKYFTRSKARFQLNSINMV